MNARTDGVGSLKINFAISDVFYAKLGTLEVRKLIPLLCDSDDLAITEDIDYCKVSRRPELCLWHSLRSAIGINLKLKKL